MGTVTTGTAMVTESRKPGVSSRVSPPVTDLRFRLKTLEAASEAASRLPHDDVR
jgi:hypothetical protein